MTDNGLEATVPTTTEARLKQLIGEIKEDAGLADAILPSADLLNDVQLDSLEFINLVLMLEDEFDVELDFDNFDFAAIATVSALAGYIDELRGVAAREC